MSNAETKQGKRRMPLYLLGAAVLLVPLALLGILVATVDDWSRDLTQNYAETSPDAADPALRPIEIAGPPDELTAAVARAVARLPRWVQGSQEVSGDATVLRLVRTTPLMRFQDDITVRVRPSARGSRLEASSKSRVGKGDLGQNPRNLRELLTAVREELRGQQ
jgi:uncharacterized protein (DUF1499 family)